MQFRNWIVGMVIVSLFVIVNISFLAQLESQYAHVDNTQANLSTYDKLDELTNTTQQLSDQTRGINQSSGLTDIIGHYIGRATGVVKTTTQSYDVSAEMGNSALNSAGLGPMKQHFRTALFAILSIAVTFGLVSIYLRRKST
jgi:hypothetical protein